ncbi:MAG: hypothetical protein B9S32_14725 [Verrucomicrobia bacterium Tous-C9LFEB]|nr:MAG: hypothetical protein B9S32_14725 [Verrucomicrobia bacterium Tous-C9LFEB]
MIITCKKQIPLRWIFFSILPWASFAYTWAMGGTTFLFSLKKFLENPAAVTFILSLPTLISLFTGPYFSFLSDRIWTRYGRRKPLLILSFTGVMLSLAAMPWMPNFWTLVAVYLLYCFFGDLNTMELLKQEIVPPHERGRATGAMLWCTNLAGIFFNFVALGRFDDVSFYAGFPIAGECILYLSASLLISVMLLLVMLGIKEIDQHSPVRGQHFSLRNFAVAITDRELWPVYLLIFGSAVLNAGLGPLANLLYTEQWGYSKQEMGINIAVGGVINIFLIGALTVFADKLNRMRAYQTLICLSLGLNVAYFSYVTFVLPDQRPSLVEIILFGELSSVVGLLTSMIYYPLVYDYIRRNKMGTYAAGAGLVMRLTGLMTLNGVGLFIWAYATLFQPPAGEMVRVVLKGGDANTQAHVQSLLHAASWSNPTTGAPATSTLIDARAWQSDGTVSSFGRAWEIRLRNPQSAELAKTKEELNKEISLLQSQSKILTDRLAVAEIHTDAKCSASLKQELLEKQKCTESLSQQTTQIQETLNQQARKFEAQVQRVLSAQLLTDGDQILRASTHSAAIVEYALTAPPKGKELEKILEKLRQLEPDVIDLRPLKKETDYAVELSLLSTSNENALAEKLKSSLQRAASETGTHLKLKTNHPFQITRLPALQFDVLTVEPAVTDYISPVTRGVNVILNVFDAAPRPDRKLTALARSLRAPSDVNHVKITPGPEKKSFTVQAVLPPHASTDFTASTLISERMRQLLGSTTSPQIVSQALHFYERVDANSAAQRLTIAKPVLATAYAPMRYNYMCGYLWMFIMGSIGITITFIFCHYESKGYIHKCGVEEAEAT